MWLSCECWEWHPTTITRTQHSQHTWPPWITALNNNRGCHIHQLTDHTHLNPITAIQYIRTLSTSVHSEVYALGLITIDIKPLYCHSLSSFLNLLWFLCFCLCLVQFMLFVLHLTIPWLLTTVLSHALDYSANFSNNVIVYLHLYLPCDRIFIFTWIQQVLWSGFRHWTYRTAYSESSNSR